jgi:hypothetical protein
MRRLLAWLLLAGAVGAAPALATDQPAEAPPQQTTQVAGTVPDLVGRWLVAARIEIPNRPELGSSIAALWDVSAPGGKITVTVPQVELPQALRDELAQANSKHAPWEPTERELRDVRDGWDRLPALDRGVGRIETKLTGSDAFDATMKGEERMKGAHFIVQQIVDFQPGGGRPIKDVYIYGALEQRPDGWTGNYMTASVAPTPIPIPITMNGTFRLYRLDSVPAPGLLERLLGVFAGCGRRSTTTTAVPEPRLGRAGLVALPPRAS